MSPEGSCPRFSVHESFPWAPPKGLCLCSTRPSRTLISTLLIDLWGPSGPSPAHPTSAAAGVRTACGEVGGGVLGGLFGGQTLHRGRTAGALRAHVSKTTQRRTREETSSMRMQQHNIKI